MKKLILLFLFFTVSIFIYSYTNISGALSGTLTAGTYRVNGDIEVLDDTTLIIEAGSVLKFDPFTQFNIYGTLNAIGTSGNNIYFTSRNDDDFGETVIFSDGEPTNGDWDGIVFDGSGSNEGSCNMNYCGVYFGGGNSGTPLANIRYYYSESASIQNSDISFSENHGIYVDTCSPQIQTVYVDYHLDTGIYIAGNSNAVVSYCYIENNTNYGLYVTDLSSNPTISNNTFRYNTLFPVRTHCKQINNFSDNTITSNMYDEVYVDGGTIEMDSYWRNQAVPYRIDSHIYVQGIDVLSNVTTLTIEEGSVLKFESGVYLWIGHNSNSNYPGALQAVGTQTDRVYFTSNQDTPTPGYWGGIYFANYSDDLISYMDYCVVSYGGYGSYNNITCYYSSPTIQRTYIHHGDGYGINLTSSSPIITNCNISDNSYGIFCDASSPAINLGNIHSNTGYGIHLISSSSPSITNAGIHSNGNFGVYIEASSASPAISGCNIDSNSSYPIRLYASQINGITDNTFSSNTYQKIFVDGETLYNDSFWTNQGIPYFIFTSVSVQGTDGTDNLTTMTIEEGTALEFDTGTRLSIGHASDPAYPGALVATGTQVNPVYFTSDETTPSAGSWDGLVFLNYADDTLCNLEYCHILYGAETTLYNVCIDACSPTFSNCYIQNSAAWGVYLENGANPSFNDCMITYNYSDGVMNSSASSTFNNCTISLNGQNGILSQVGTNLTITGSEISNNANNGIYYLGSSTSLSIEGNQFFGNTEYPINTTAPMVQYITNNTFSGGAINVNGGTVNIDATWENQGIPFSIASSVYVQGMDGLDNVTNLNIQAGSELQFYGTGLYIGHDSNSNYIGALSAIGTEDEPILFTSNQPVPNPGDWDRINFSNFSDDTQCEMNHCIVEYAGASAPAIYCYSSSPNIQNSKIRYSGNGGLLLFNSNASISFSEIYDNLYAGIQVQGNGFNPLVDRSTICNNDYGIDIGSGTTVSISNSIIWNNYLDGIYIPGTGVANCTYSDIQNTQTGTGNISYDPGLYDIFAGDFSLMFYSPCINSGDPATTQDPDGTVADMGARYFDTTQGKPSIATISDVPNDQGRQVHVIWNKCGFDNMFSSVPISMYSIWRNDGLIRNENIKIIKEFSEIVGKTDDKKEKELIYYQHGRDILTFITQVPAMGYDQYAVVSPTLMDSSNTGNNESIFTVIAHADFPYVYYPSDPDSGYSVDNIAPIATRTTITKQSNSYKIQWEEVEYGEFEGNYYPEQNGIWYKVYAGDSPYFFCDQTTLVTTATNLEYLYNLTSDTKKFFKVVVSDNP